MSSPQMLGAIHMTGDPYLAAVIRILQASDDEILEMQESTDDQAQVASNRTRPLCGEEPTTKA